MVSRERGESAVFIAMDKGKTIDPLDIFAGLLRDNSLQCSCQILQLRAKFMLWVLRGFS